MSKREDKRAEVIERLARHFLSEGLGDSGLRKLAEVAGTSDRMLLYYFDNKDELLAAVLAHIAGGMNAALSSLFGEQPRAPALMLQQLWRVACQPDFAAHLNLWLEMSSRAGRGDLMAIAVVTQISASWTQWLASLLDVPEDQQLALANLLLAVVDGQLVMFPDDLSRGEAAINLLIEKLSH